MVSIRLATTDDAPSCREIYAPYVRETAVTFEQSVPSPGEFRERMEQLLDSYPWLVSEHENDICGYAYASPHRDRGAYQWSVESSVYVSESFHRSGIATALYNALFAVLREQGYVNVYAGTTLPNPPSVNFHQSIGFESVARYPNAGYKSGEWHDVQWWHYPVQSPPDEPAPPTPIGEFAGTATLEDALATGRDDITL
ncbi:MAG: N-acetyltransferase family protein [archaeon]